MNVMYAQQGQQQYQRPPNQGFENTEFNPSQQTRPFQGNPNYPRQNSRGSLFD
jgi:hypothetical protein